MCAEMNNLIDQRPQKASHVTPMEEADLSSYSARGIILCVFLVDCVPTRWMLVVCLGDSQLATRINLVLPRRP